MTQFIAIAALMLIVGLAWLLLPLLRRRTHKTDIDRAATSLDILKDQLADLEAEHRRGAVSPAQYAETKAELERRVLDEVQAAPGAARVSPSWHGRIAAAALGVAVPVVAVLLYAQLGDPGAFNPIAQKGGGGGAGGGASGEHQLNEAEIGQMVKSLEERLQKEPDNADGWSMLARTYYFQRKFPEAARAYKRLTELVPNEAGVLADYADALAMASGRKLAGEPMDLVKRALTLDPTQWKALAMAGTEAFDRKDYKAAVDYWERLRTSLPPDSSMRQQIAGSIAEARELGGLKAAASDANAAIATAPAAAGTASTARAPAAAAGAPSDTRVAGTVTLGAQLRDKVAPEDTVFIFARPAEGSRMPLALLRVQVKDLPKRFTLDDTMAISPDVKLSAFSEVVVGARVSKSGNAMPQSGDLEGLSARVQPGKGEIKVTIDRVLP